MPLNFFKTSTVVTTVLGLSVFAYGQDWTSASETLYFEYDVATSQQRVSTEKLREVSQACDIDTIIVVGHTDSSGNAAYNSALSLRRAELLKQELIAMGMSPASITTRGAGESELAVLTGDGVKEALNRRAEVTLGFSQPCGIYFSQPTATVQPAETITYTDPATYTYTDPTPVTQAAPQPSYVQSAPTPVAQAPVPVTAPPSVPVMAPPPPVVPVAAVGGVGIPAAVIGVWAVAGAVIVAEADDDDEPVSP